MKRRYIILQLLGLCSVLPVFMATVSAQNNIVVRAQMDSAAIMMGDQTTVRLEVSQDKDKFVKLPIIQDTLVTGVEVLKVSKPDTIDLKNNRIQINNEVLVTSFRILGTLLPTSVQICHRRRYFRDSGVESQSSTGSG